MKSKKLTKLETDLIESALSEKYRVFFKLALQTGLRVSELLSIRRDSLLDSNGEVRGLLTIERRNVKCKRSSRSIPLTTEMRQALRLYLDTIQGQKIFDFTRKCYNEALKNAAVKVGIDTKGISSHTTRKTFATSIYERSGNDVALTARALGHRSLSSTIHYLSVDDEKLNNFILGNVS